MVMTSGTTFEFWDVTGEPTAADFRAVESCIR